MHGVITLDDLEKMSQENLHLLAHAIATQEGVAFDCEHHNMNKEAIIAWIKKVAFGLEGKAN